MAKIRHSIVLDLSGNIDTQLQRAVKTFEKLGNAAQKAGKGVGGVVSGLGGDAGAGDDHPASSAGARTENARRRDSLRTMQSDAAAGLVSMQVAGLAGRAASSMMTGGSVSQTASMALTGAGGVISSFAKTSKGRAVGMGTSIVGGILGAFTNKLPQGEQIASRIRSTEASAGAFGGMKRWTEQANQIAEAYGLKPEEVRGLQEQYARATGSQVSNAELGVASRAQKAFNISSESSVGMMGLQRRFGKSSEANAEQFKNIMATAVQVGINRGSITDYMDTVADLQRQTVMQTTKLVDATSIANGVATIQQLDAGFQGEGGRAIAQTIDSGFKGASTGGGLLLASAMAGGTDYFSARKQLDLGATNTNIAAFSKFLKSLGVDENMAGLLTEQAFPGMTFTAASEYASGVKAKGVVSGAPTLLSQQRTEEMLKATKDSEAYDIERVAAERTVVDESAAIIAAKAERKIVRSFSKGNSTAVADQIVTADGKTMSVGDNPVASYNPDFSSYTGDKKQPVAEVNIKRNGTPVGKVTAPVFSGMTIPVRQ